jgi:hypothetical protein
LPGRSDPPGPWSSGILGPSVRDECWLASSFNSCHSFHAKLFFRLLEANRHAPIANAPAAPRGFWIADRDPDDPNRPDEDEARVYVYDVINANWGVSAQQFVPAIAALILRFTDSYYAKKAQVGFLAWVAPTGA